MTILIAGLGSIGRRHMRNFQQLGEEIVLFRSGKTTLPEEDLTEHPSEWDLDDALDRWRPSGVVVSNPTSMHLEVALPAARAGCDILLEKPVSHSLEGLSDLAEILAEQNKRAVVGYQFRYHPGLMAIKALLLEARLGRPLSVSAHWGEYLPDWHPWENYRESYAARKDLGGGVFLTLSHPFDYLCWLFGEIKSVSAMISNIGLKLDVEDTAEVILEFNDGLLGHVHLNYNQRPPRHTIEIVCESGTIDWDYFAGLTQVWTAGNDAPEVIPLPPKFERNDMFLAEDRNFLDVIKGVAAPGCSLQDGIRALEIALSARESAVRGQAAFPGSVEMG